MKDKAKPKGKNANAKPRKRPTRAEIARHISIMKKRLTFHSFLQQEGTT